MIAKLMRMQLLEEADVDATGSSSPDEEKRMADGRPAWMRTLQTSVTTWLKLVPQVSHQHSFFSPLKDACLMLCPLKLNYFSAHHRFIQC